MKQALVRHGPENKRTAILSGQIIHIGSESAPDVRHPEVICSTQRLQGQPSLVSQTVKHLSPMLETWVRSLSWEDPLEKETATHSNTFAWKIPWTEERGSHSPWGCKDLDTID